jgi:Amt family ammonium transporter
VAAGVLAMLIGLLAQILGCTAVHGAHFILGAAGEGLLAAAAGGLAGLTLGRVRYATTDFHLTAVGLLGGVISIAAGAGYFSAAVSVLTGAIGGLLAAWASVWIDLKRRIDDPASAIAVHGVAGAWGVMVAALLYFPPFPLVQMLGIAAIGGAALACCSAVYLVFGVAGGLRVAPADELDGADLAEHDVNAYPDFQQNMIKSHHLRQM